LEINFKSHNFLYTKAKHPPSQFNIYSFAFRARHYWLPDSCLISKSRTLNTSEDCFNYFIFII